MEDHNIGRPLYGLGWTRDAVRPHFQAFGIDPNECFDLAFDEELEPGKYLPVYFACMKIASAPSILTTETTTDLKSKEPT
jgi:hypothetical protein